MQEIWSGKKQKGVLILVALGSTTFYLIFHQPPFPHNSAPSFLCCWSPALPQSVPTPSFRVLLLNIIPIVSFHFTFSKQFPCCSYGSLHPLLSHFCCRRLRSSSAAYHLASGRIRRHSRLHSGLAARTPKSEASWVTPSTVDS